MVILIVLSCLVGITLMILFLGLKKPKPPHKEKYEEEHTLVYDDDPLKRQEERENYIFENEC